MPMGTNPPCNTLAVLVGMDRGHTAVDHTRGTRPFKRFRSSDNELRGGAIIGARRSSRNCCSGRDNPYRAAKALIHGSIERPKARQPCRLA